MMKKLALRLCALATAFVFSAAVAFGDTYTDGNGVTWEYSVSGGKATIGNGGSSAIPSGTSGSLAVPESINGYPVTSIGDDAFAWCGGLTSMTIPEGVTSIGDGAFYYCYGLTSVTIPSSVTSIGDYAFAWCSGLTSVTIPSSVTSIGEYAFYECSGLTSVTIPSSVTSIGNYAFYRCSGLTSVTIPSSVTSIGDYAFSNCGGLAEFVVDNDNSSYSSVDGILYDKSQTRLVQCPGAKGGTVTIPQDVTDISVNAFVGCGLLTEIAVESGNLSYCSINGILYDRTHTRLVRCPPGMSGGVTIPDGVTSIDVRAFYGCSGLTSVTIPEGVTSIGDGTFRDCGGLTSVTIPEGVRSIGASAFRDCSGLASVTIPSSVMTIGFGVFLDCSGLTSVTISEGVTSIGDEAFDGCSGLTSVTIPEGVTSIGDWAFLDCSGLTSVTIPSSVTSIGYMAFSDCSGLTSFVFSGGVPDVSNDFGSYCSAGYYPSKFSEEWEAVISTDGTWRGLHMTRYDLESQTQTTPVPVPYEWLDEYGLGGTEAAYETAAMAMAANGVNKVWACYVAGLDPTDEDAVFRARIAFEDGVPVVSWEPKLPPEEEAKRIYTIEGKAELGGTWNSPVEASHRFFHVKVEMK